MIVIFLTKVPPLVTKVPVYGYQSALRLLLKFPIVTKEREREGGREGGRERETETQTTRTIGFDNEKWWKKWTKGRNTTSLSQRALFLDKVNFKLKRSVRII